jgi:hypothetical protein
MLLAQNKKMAGARLLVQHSWEVFLEGSHHEVGMVPQQLAVGTMVQQMVVGMVHW